MSSLCYAEIAPNIEQNEGEKPQTGEDTIMESDKPEIKKLDNNELLEKPSETGQPSNNNEVQAGTSTNTTEKGQNADMVSFSIKI